MSEPFNYHQPAELYPGKQAYKGKRTGYMRFPSAAEAIRFAVEQIPPEFLRNTALESGEIRVEGEAIRELYVASAYPLPRG